MVMRCERLSEHDERIVDNHSRLPAPLVYEVIRRDGIEEMMRPNSSLIWSGIAAGILISFSVVSEALFRVHLTETPWRPLIENLGYSVGFLIVILGRMQLFTENTITTVLPTATAPTLGNFLTSARVWTIVFGANLIGAAIAAAFMIWSSALDPALQTAVREISEHAVGYPPMEIFVRGIPAGILIAAVVWMLPSAASMSFFVVLFFTYLIALGSFTHVVAGSVEAAYLVFDGRMDFFDSMFGFLVPAFFGNVVGGTVVFALLAYGQVSAELPADDEEDINAAREEKLGLRTDPAE